MKINQTTCEHIQTFASDDNTIASLEIYKDILLLGCNEGILKLVDCKLMITRSNDYKDVLLYDFYSLIIMNNEIVGGTSIGIFVYLIQKQRNNNYLIKKRNNEMYFMNKVIQDIIKINSS